ncbi:GNAT family N-acetyltransferase [Rhizobium sp.]
MTVIIRAVGPADLDGLLALYAQLNPLDPVLPPDVARQRFEALVAHPGLTVFGAFDSNRLVASCVLHVLPNLTRGAMPYALIENVVTDAAERRQGHGQRVVRAAAAAGFAEGCYKVMLMTGRSDPGVIKFYESCGFTQSKTGFQMRGV